ncbi:hypothetical protein AURDEDRAFT_177792 [Auricularia subglabra TFB-10046 SS5]|uniref:Uncharacterized protein n=1 Tax=Auricularia subglabra (strain TFB-10046 / SS5) TaxID=717982 RepID=J0D383_AURST|nr:hypothetical protein AURDEDRAFT_177792 [Auricularia subglabra TFB-10046 SS5]
MLYETMAPTSALPALAATPRSSRTHWKALGDRGDALRDHGLRPHLLSPHSQRPAGPRARIGRHWETLEMLCETMAPTSALPALATPRRSSRTHWKALGDPGDALRDHGMSIYHLVLFLALLFD